MPAEIIHIQSKQTPPSQISAAADVLKAGGLVVIPTETVYGVGGLVAHPDARRRLDAMRPPGSAVHPLTLHVASVRDALTFTGDVSRIARQMMRKLWPGPVAIILEVQPQVRQQVSARLGVDESVLYHEGRITIRYPDHPVASALIAAAGGNLFAMRAETQINNDQSSVQFDEALKQSVDLILDAGPPRYAKPSTIVSVSNDYYDIVRQGVYDARIIDKSLQTHILFVCSGNTCRSPMAESLARKVLSDKLGILPGQLADHGIIVSSAGTTAYADAPAAQPAVEVMKEYGVNLAAHRSRRATVESVHQSDIIFVMQRHHAEDLSRMVPGAANKIVMLDPDGDIMDPIGGDVDLYRRLAVRLQVLIEMRLKKYQLL